MNITYVLQSFPQTSETFIINEILALQKNKPDLNISIISLKRPKSPASHASVASLTIKYLTETKVAFFKIALFVLKQIFSHPFRSIQTMYYFANVPRGNLLYYYLIRYWYLLYMLFRLAYILENHRTDHIHAHFGNNPAQFAMCASLLTGIPYSFTTHARDIFVYHEILTAKHCFADFAVTISRYNKLFLEKRYSIPTDRIKIVHCGIDTSCFAFKAYPHHNEKHLKIISIGRLVDKKGFIYLINACKRLSEMNISFHCDIIGNGPLRDSLQSSIDISGLHNQIILHGEQTQEQVRSMLEKSDVFVLPCIQADDGDMDGSPMVLKEAMAMGVVCVSSRISGILELMPENSGILVNQKDDLALCDAIKSIYGMTIEKKNTIAKAQRKIIENSFDINKQADQLYRLFMHLLD